MTGQSNAPILNNVYRKNHKVSLTRKTGFIESRGTFFHTYHPFQRKNGTIYPNPAFSRYYWKQEKVFLTFLTV